MKKKLISVVVTLAIIGAITGCGGSEQSQENSSSTPSSENVSSSTETTKEESEVVETEDTKDTEAEVAAEKSDDSQLASILNTIKGEEQKAVEKLSGDLDTVYEGAGETYEEVKSNIALIEGWYELEEAESEKLYDLIEQATAAYYREMAASLERNSEAWSDACDLFNDEICQGLFDDYKAKIYDGFYNDIKTKYYDGIISAAEDTQDYSSWLDIYSGFYSNWLDAESDFYSEWLETESDIYSTMLEMISAKYDDEFDVEKFISEHGLGEAGNFEVDPNAAEVSFNNEDAKESDTGEKDIDVDFDSVTEWYQTNPMLIGEGIYFVGTDIAPASYGIKCDTADYGMAVIVFDSVDAYYAYHHSSRFTVGEENDAIEANASLYEYIYEDDEIALNLREGNVLRIKDGIGELLSSDPNASNETETQVGGTTKLFDGNYVVGKDLDAGGYMITATGDYGTRFVVFESEQKLADFDAADHFTNGEFGADVEQNAMMDIYVDKGKQCYINLQDGMVLMLNNGSGIAQEVKMAWAK